MKNRRFMLAAFVAVGAGGSDLPRAHAEPPRPEWIYRNAQVVLCHPTGPIAVAVAVADLDGDGDQDMLVADAAGDNVGVLLNHGGGPFGVPIWIDLPNGSTVDLEIADFNQDGIPDFVVIVAPTTHIYLGNGDGTFIFRHSILDEVNASYDLIVGDWDGDGDPDLAFQRVDPWNDFLVHINTGTGVFGPGVSYATGKNPFGIASGDIDGDGDLDIATSNYDDPLDADVTVRRNFGNASFDVVNSYDVGNESNELQFADADGDGDLDLFVLNQSSVAVLMNDGTGAYATPPAQYPTGDSPDFLAVGDLDLDGDPDVVLTSFNDDVVRVLTNVGDGTLSAPEEWSMPCGPRQPILADLNGDGWPELVVPVSSDEERIAIRVNRGDTVFRSRVEHAGALQTISDIVAADFNGDGILDLVAARSSLDELSVYIGRPDGSFPDEVGYEVSEGPVDVVAADFNNDGWIDFASANTIADNVSVFYNNGDGTFGPEVPLAVGLFPTRIDVGDFAGDGYPDLVVVNVGTDDASLLPNTDDGFLAQERFLEGLEPRDLVVGDLDGDLDLDVAVIAGGGCRAASVLNDGGVLGPPSCFLAPNNALDMTLGDLDEDGDLDLLIARIDGIISIYRNNGSAGFTADSSVVLCAGVDRIEVVDVNGDAHLDLLTIDRNVELRVFFGSETIEFGEPVGYGGSTSPTFTVGDFDGDFDQDIALPSRSDRGLTTMLNIMNCRGDFDGSRRVDFGDVLDVFAAWGPCGSSCPEDLDRNATVDFADVLQLVAAWGACP